MPSSFTSFPIPTILLDTGTVTAAGSTTAVSLANRFAYRINAKDFGAAGNWVRSGLQTGTGTDDSAAMTAAVLAAQSLATAFAVGSGANIIYQRSHPYVELENFAYRIASGVTFNNNGACGIRGNGAAIYPGSATYAFTGNAVYLGLQDLCCIEGAGLLNGGTSPTGSFGQTIEFDNCQIQNNTSTAIVIGASGSGSIVSYIKNINWLTQVASGGFVDTWADITHIHGCWMTPNTPWAGYPVINRQGLLYWHNNIEVPNSTSLNTTTAWVQNYGIVIMSSGRFGAEGGGGPCLVDNYGTGAGTGVFIHDTHYNNQSLAPIIRLYAIPEVVSLHNVTPIGSHSIPIWVDPSLNLTSFANSNQAITPVKIFVGPGIEIQWQGNPLAAEILGKYIDIGVNPKTGPNSSGDARNLFPTQAQWAGSGWTFAFASGPASSGVITMPSGSPGFRWISAGSNTLAGYTPGNLFANAPQAGIYTYSFKARAKRITNNTSATISVQNVCNEITPTSEFNTYRFPVYYDGSTGFSQPVQVNITGTDTGSFIDFGDFALHRGWDTQPWAPAYTDATKWDGATTALTSNFATTNGAMNLDITVTGHGLVDGQLIRLSSFATVNNIVPNGVWVATVVDANTLRVWSDNVANATASSVGGTGNLNPQFVAIGNHLFWGYAAPTHGDWLVGDEIMNRKPTVGSPNGWKCTVSGTPGTWVALANL